MGVTTLKKVCRHGGVPRWPFRKRSSLDNLIEKTAQFIKVTDDETARNKCLALQALEQQRRSLQVGGRWRDVPLKYHAFSHSTCWKHGVRCLLMTVQ